MINNDDDGDVKLVAVLPNVVLAYDHTERRSSRQLPTLPEKLQITLKHRNTSIVLRQHTQHSLHREFQLKYTHDSTCVLKEKGGYVNTWQYRLTTADDQPMRVIQLKHKDTRKPSYR